MTVGELRKRMSAEEFTEWAAYYTVEPWGEDRADLRSGVVASLLYNINRAKDAEPRSPSDFMLFKDQTDAPPETPAPGTELRARFMALFPPKD